MTILLHCQNGWYSSATSSEQLTSAHQHVRVDGGRPSSRAQFPIFFCDYRSPPPKQILDSAHKYVHTNKTQENLTRVKRISIKNTILILIHGVFLCVCWGGGILGLGHHHHHLPSRQYCYSNIFFKKKNKQTLFFQFPLNISKQSLLFKTTLYSQLFNTAL